MQSQEWTKQATSSVKPNARYGQSQIWLKDDRILIIGGFLNENFCQFPESFALLSYVFFLYCVGGCGGPNMIYNDVWLLSLKDNEWEWREVAVQGREWAATYMWCHRACRVRKPV